MSTSTKAADSATPAVEVSGLSKVYASGHQALKDVNLSIRSGEIFALLGPNGAGKTTLIGIICGLVNPGVGHIRVDGFDVVREYRATRKRIGLVPQELTTDAFETVWDTVNFSRGLFGLPKHPAYIEQILRDLSLWEKRDNKMLELSGGMKRRVMIAKALSHEPTVLFLDEPTAGVDVSLRRDMWQLVSRLRDNGVTIILTTHYIEEAEEMADRVGVINKGQIMLVEQTSALMHKLGKKSLTVQLQEPIQAIPEALSGYALELEADGSELTYTYDTQSDHTGITGLLAAISAAGLHLRDLRTKQNSLEEIFVDLVQEKRA
ncbi:ABC transporter ATP-binding protein [Oleiagrimonas sp. C23AA]|uniref:ABC transporter ATP-binding protein n=1 Tax=Oleiagrimonas sp. C23AA TaxID=2719047 RepID=UPI00141DB180|nr:ABC transporter ATP-binding protein [Oleiagrimonas sp. C23AA]NII09559.1 ABC transporter ATP-binding protein [Oleiagrimonas sp. C23AA]